MVDHLNQPGLWVSSRVQLGHGNEEGFLDNVARILLLEAMLPGGPSDERKKVLSIELGEAFWVRGKGGAGRRPTHALLPFSLHNRLLVDQVSLFLLSRAWAKGEKEWIRPLPSEHEATS